MKRKRSNIMPTTLPTAGFWSSDYGWRLAGANSLWNIAKPSAGHRPLVAERKKDPKDAAGEAFAKLAKALAENPEEACKFFHDKQREGKVKEALKDAAESETNITEKDGIFTVEHGGMTYTVAYVTQDSDRFAQAQLFAEAKRQKLTAPTVFVGAAVSGKVVKKDDEGKTREVNVSYVPVFIEKLEVDPKEKGLADALAGMKIEKGDKKGELDKAKIEGLADRLANAWDEICLNIGLDNVFVIEKREGDSTTYEIVLRADKEDVRGGSLADGKVLSMKHFIDQLKKKRVEIDEKTKLKAQLAKLKEKKALYDKIAKLDDKAKGDRITHLEGTIKFRDAAIKKLTHENESGAQAKAEKAQEDAQEAFDTAVAEAVKAEEAALKAADQAVLVNQNETSDMEAKLAQATQNAENARKAKADHEGGKAARDEREADAQLLEDADRTVNEMITLKGRYPTLANDASNASDIVREIRSEIERYDAVNIALEKNVKDAEAAETSARAQLGELQAAKAALDKTAQEKQSTFVKAKEEAAKKDEVKTKREALDKANKYLKEQNEIIRKNKKKIEEHEVKICSLQEEVNALKLTKDQLEAEANKLERTEKQKVDGKDTDVTVGEIADLYEKIKAIDAKNAHLTTLSEALKGRLNGLHVHQADFVWKVIATFLWVVTLGGTLNGWLAARGINEQRDALLEAMTKQKKAKAELKKAEDGKNADAKKAYEAAKAEKRKAQAALVGRIGA
ncbi:MAG: hypothetical protein KDK65_02500, partial [Chlamydiia bacterium]|nr:hypothetical protein [Chlamydiia bacterium]